MAQRNITYQTVTALAPRERNPRTHSKKQIRQIADSITEFGFTNPVLVDRDNRIIAGHGRVEAAKLLGLETVPTICLDDLTPAQVRAYVIADNKLAENAGWDTEILAIELQGLIELDFNVELTGFATAEVDLIIIPTGNEANRADPADKVPEADRNTPAVSRLGDLWLLGEHRLYCGDATDPASYTAVLRGEKAQAVFTDPPYNVPVQGHVSGLGKVKHQECAMASGEMSEAEFIAFLRAIAERLTAFSGDGSIHFICMDWRHGFELQAAARSVYSELKNIAVWVKSNGGMGSLYRSQHELVFVFKNGAAPHINNVELGKHGRYRTNVWEYAGVNSFGAARDEELAMHPTVKPLALVADAMLDVSRRGGLVLDPFSGSGTTIMAAEKTGRRAAAIEIDPHYVDVAIARFQKHTGKAVTLAATGETFEATRATRAQAVTGEVA